MAAFVSYSRAWFYFAEDLALALGQHGVDVWFDVHRLRPADDWEAEIEAALRACDGLVLVASADALSSPHVRAELELARQLGKPIVVVLAEHVDLPDALADAPRLDLCTGFEQKVGWLAAGLKDGDYETPTGGAHPSRAGQAGAVRFVSFVLLGTAVFFAAVCLVVLVAGLPDAVVQSTAFFVLLLALIAAFCGWQWWALSKRFSGSATTLGFVFVSGIPGAVVIVLGSLVVLHVSEGVLGPVVTLIVLALLALVAAWFVAAGVALTTGSFYRWLPIGDAPGWMRRRMLARRGRRAGGPSNATRSIAYDIACHELDRSVERGLDRALQARGHRRAGGARADREIVVLSDMTPVGGLGQRLAALGERAVVVIAAPVSVAGLEHAERHQWVDHRRRSRATLERLAADIEGAPVSATRVEPVPESLGRRVVPAGVLVVGVLCVLAAAVDLGTGIGGLAGADTAAIYGAERSIPRSLAALLLGAAALWLAAALVARRIPMLWFAAGFAGVYLATLGLPRLADVDPPAWTQLPSATVGAVALLFGWRALADWLPPRMARSEEPTLVADRPPLWMRPAVRAVAVYTVALSALLIAMILPAKGTLSAPPDRLLIGAGYTAARPAGWRGETAQPGSPRLVLARGDAVSRQEIVVRVPLDLAPADAVAIRERLILAGALHVTPAQPAAVDQEPATTFSYGKLLPSGQTVRRRKVVLPYGGLNYDITLTAPEAAFADAEDDFAAFLRSWRWARAPGTAP